MFLSRLNKTNRGCEKILPVSGSFYAVSVKIWGETSEKQDALQNCVTHALAAEY